MRKTLNDKIIKSIKELEKNKEFKIVGLLLNKKDSIEIRTIDTVMQFAGFPVSIYGKTLFYGKQPKSYILYESYYEKYLASTFVEELK